MTPCGFEPASRAVTSGSEVPKLIHAPAGRNSMKRIGSRRLFLAHRCGTSLRRTCRWPLCFDITRATSPILSTIFPLHLKVPNQGFAKRGGMADTCGGYSNQASLDVEERVVGSLLLWHVVAMNVPVASVLDKQHRWMCKAGLFASLTVAGRISYLLIKKMTPAQGSWLSYSWASICCEGGDIGGFLRKGTYYGICRDTP